MYKRPTVLKFTHSINLERERERWVTNKGKKTWEGRRGEREIKGVIFFVVVLMISCEVNALTVLVLLSLFMRFLFSSETQFLSVLFLHRFFHSLITCSFCSLEFVMADFFFS